MRIIDYNQQQTAAIQQATLGQLGYTCYPYPPFEAAKPQGGNKMFADFKKYLGDNRDFIFTLGLLILADHFILGGALRSKLEGILHSKCDALVKANATNNS